MHTSKDQPDQYLLLRAFHYYYLLLPATICQLLLMTLQLLLSYKVTATSSCKYWISTITSSETIAGFTYGYSTYLKSFLPFLLFLHYGRSQECSFPRTFHTVFQAYFFSTGIFFQCFVSFPAFGGAKSYKHSEYKRIQKNKTVEEELWKAKKWKPTKKPGEKTKTKKTWRKQKKPGKTKQKQ